MKPFIEFWESISEDEMVKISEVASERAANVHTEDPKYQFGTQISVVSTMMSMQLLNRYHDWLSEQL